jgi:hypothetical protein
MHERDQLLGASWQPYAYQWRGYSQCSPTLDHADMEKAVRWAVHSATHAGEQPTCTVYAPNTGTHCGTWMRMKTEHYGVPLLQRGGSAKLNQIDNDDPKPALHTSRICAAWLAGPPAHSLSLMAGG